MLPPLIHMQCENVTRNSYCFRLSLRYAQDTASAKLCGPIRKSCHAISCLAGPSADPLRDLWSLVTCGKGLLGSRSHICKKQIVNVPILEAIRE